jgi:hypothetical protein
MKAQPRGGAAESGVSTRPYTTKVDPIEQNGAIFANWPKPDVLLVFSGEQDGYLEPCGCAGLENQKGGLQRRFTLLKELRAKGWPIVAMDSGSQEKRTGVQANWKLDFTYRALTLMKYAAVGIGPQDLKLDLIRSSSIGKMPRKSSYRRTWRWAISTAAFGNATRSLNKAA